MPKAEKVERVNDIKASFEGSEAAIFADYRGLSVPDIGEVRTALVEAQARFRVLKNTLTRLAVKDLDLADLEEFLEGPTAVAFVNGDIVVGAKALIEAAKKFPVLEVKGGLAEGRILSADQIKELASLDTREVMLSRIAGMLQMHLRTAAYLFQAIQSRFVATLKAYEEKLAEGAPAEAPAAEPEAPAAEQPEPEVPTEQPEPETPTTQPEEEGGEETPAPAPNADETSAEQAAAEDERPAEQAADEDEQKDEEGA